MEETTDTLNIGFKEEVKVLLKFLRRKLWFNKHHMRRTDEKVQMNQTGELMLKVIFLFSYCGDTLSYL